MLASVQTKKKDGARFSGEHHTASHEAQLLPSSGPNKASPTPLTISSFQRLSLFPAQSPPPGQGLSAFRRGQPKPPTCWLILWTSWLFYLEWARSYPCLGRLFGRAGSTKRHQACLCSKAGQAGPGQRGLVVLDIVCLAEGCSQSGGHPCSKRTLEMNPPCLVSLNATNQYCFAE